MSADNGIYILKTGSGSRVIHAQAIENIYWDCMVGRESTLPLSFNLVHYFHDAEEMPHPQALVKANEMAEECPILEYGVSVLPSTSLSWDEIVAIARHYARVWLTRDMTEKQKSDYASELEFANNLVNGKVKFGGETY